MNYFQEKKLAFMSIVNRVKGFIRTVTGVLPLTLEGCVDEESIIDYTLYGNSVQDDTPAPEALVEVESVGEKTRNLFNPDVPYEQGFLNASGNGIIKNKDFPNIHLFTIAVKPNTTYSYNGVIMNNTTYALLNSNMEYLGKYGGNISSKQNITFETTSDTAYVQICSSLANFQKGILYFNEGEQYIEEPYYDGYKIPIKVSGKNLYNKNIDEKIVISASGTTRYGVKINSCNEPITVSGLYKQADFIAYKTIKDGIYSTYREMPILPHTITDTGDTLVLYFGAEASKFSERISNLQIEYGYTATDYEPYHETTTNIYLDEPLRKVGDYADYIDFENSKVVRNVKEIRLKTAKTVYTWIGKKGVNFNALLDGAHDRSKGLCNREKRFTANGDEVTTIWLGVNTRNVYWIGILDYLGLTTVTEMNEWLTNNPTYVFYGTDLPTETPITLPPIPTFKGTSIISTDTTIQPSNAEIEYYSNVKE